MDRILYAVFTVTLNLDLAAQGFQLFYGCRAERIARGDQNLHTLLALEPKCQLAGECGLTGAVKTCNQHYAGVALHIDFGMFIPLQRAAVAALSLPLSYAENICSIYEERRDVFCGGLRSAGWDVADPKGAFFVWCPIPEGFSSSMEFCDVLLEKTGILCTPGPAFGSGGEGYVRFALVDDKEILAEAAYAIKESGL